MFYICYRYLPAVHFWPTPVPPRRSAGRSARQFQSGCQPLHRRQPTVGVRRVVKPLGAIFRGSTQRADDGVQLLDLAVRPARDAVLAAPLLQNRHAQPELRRRVFVFSERDVRVVGQFRFRRVGGKRNKKKKGLKPREGNLGGGKRWQIRLGCGSVFEGGG